MTLNYNTVETFIQEQIFPTVYDQFFSNHPVQKIIKDKTEDTHNGRRFDIMLEYASGSRAAPKGEWDTVEVGPSDPFTKAFYTPKMIVDSVSLSEQEELQMNSNTAVENILKKKTSNIRKGLEKYFAERFWSRTAAGTNDWSSLDELVGVGTFGEIPLTGNVPVWWKSQILDLKSTYYTDSAQNLDNLVNPESDVYIVKLFAEGIANAKFQTGEKPDVICMPEQIWDLTESVFNDNKLGSPLTENMLSLGFTMINYRNIMVLSDSDMVSAQVNNTDGRIYYLNTDYIKTVFNKNAKFTMKKFIQPHNALYKTALIYIYGQLAAANRGAQAVHTNIFSNKTYANRRAA